MVRECAAALLLVASSGCSLILDFDSAPPIDAMIDGITSQLECSSFEPNDSIDDAQDVTTTLAAAICAPTAGGPEDHDFFQFTTTGGAFTVALAFTSRPGGDLDLKLYSANGTLDAQSRGFGDGETIVCPGNTPVCPALPAGTHIIEVLPGAAGSINAYTLTVTK